MRSKCDAAIEAGRLLAELDPRAGLWLFGSWARGEATPRSDMDALVALPDRAAIGEARAICAGAGLSVIATDQRQLHDLPQKSPLFALHISTEARRISDDGTLPTPTWTEAQRSRATRRALGRLAAARHEIELWGASDSAAQTMVFAAVKEWAMLKAALAGQPEFDRWRAIHRLGALRSQREALLELEAVWLTRREGQPPPTLADAERVVTEALELAPVPQLA